MSKLAWYSGLLVFLISAVCAADGSIPKRNGHDPVVNVAISSEGRRLLREFFITHHVEVVAVGVDTLPAGTSANDLAQRLVTEWQLGSGLGVAGRGVAVVLDYNTNRVTVGVGKALKNKMDPVALTALIPISDSRDEWGRNIESALPQVLSYVSAQAGTDWSASNFLRKLRYGFATWLPWLVGIALLAVWWRWGLNRCPQCQRRFPKHISGRTVTRVIGSRAGTAIIKLRCRGCAYEWEIRRSIFSARRQRAGSTTTTGSRPSSKSSGSFKGFGGGSSGGGGSTRGY